jgi:hypothetical protein
MTLTDYHGFIRPNGQKGTNATNDHSQIQYALLVLALLANNPAIDYFHFYLNRLNCFAFSTSVGKDDCAHICPCGCGLLHPITLPLFSKSERD